ncbi:MAG: hypothetical protein ACOX3G_06315 [Armatimonadota bacterium]
MKWKKQAMRPDGLAVYTRHANGSAGLGARSGFGHPARKRYRPRSSIFTTIR